MLELLALPVAALLNRMRGTTSWMGKNEETGDTDGWLPGHGRLYVSPAIGLLAYLVGASWLAAAAIAATYFLWSLFPWGYLQGLGRVSREHRPPTGIEEELLQLARGNIHLAFALRHAIPVPLLWLIVGPWALAFPIAVAAAYEAAWRLNPRNPIWLGEIMTGAVWGSIIAFGI